MIEFKLFAEHMWKPFTRLGISNSFFYVSAEPIIFTWIVLAIIVILSILARLALRRPDSLPAHFVKTLVRSALNMARQAVGPHFQTKYAVFVAVIFAYILLCNIVVILPWCEEPTKDLNTTFALALLSFIYTQKEIFKAHGFVQYAQIFLKFPFTIRGQPITITRIPLLALKIILNTVVSLALFPLEAMGKIASVISLSFRLFGNIFGGAVITILWKKVLSYHPAIQIIGIVSGLNLIITFFFGLFEGFIQAFVFSTLSITYLGIGLSEEH